MLANRGRILAAAERGDRDAFLGLYDQFGPMLYRLFFWLTGSEAEARTLVTDTFRDAFRSFRRRPRDMVLDTWFYRVAVRSFLASTRLDIIFRRTLGPAEIDDRSTPWRQAVLALPPRLRVVWLLVLAEGMPQSQTAEAMRVSLDRVESLLERGRAAFAPPEPGADRATIERAMRQLSAPRPGATLRGDVAAVIGTGGATLRARLMQAGVGLMVLALVISVAFSLLRGEDETAAGPEQAEAEPKSLVVLGTADAGALASFNAQDLRPSGIIGVGEEPHALGLAADGATLYVLQSEGLLTVNAHSQQVGRLFALPAREWTVLVVAGQLAVLGSNIDAALAAVDENGETVAEFALPWPVAELVRLTERSVLAVSVDRTQVATIALESFTVSAPKSVGEGLALGAIVPVEDGSAAYVTTPASQEVWRFTFATEEAELVTATPAARAPYGALSADGSSLYLSNGDWQAPAAAMEESTPSRAQMSSAERTGQSSGQAQSNDGSDEGNDPDDEALPALTMIDTTDGSVARELWQSGGTTQLALDPERNILYALTPQASAILVLDSRTFHVRNVIPLAVRPVAFALLSQES